MFSMTLGSQSSFSPANPRERDDWSGARQFDALPIITTAVWMVWLTVGILGLIWPYPRPHPLESLEPPPTQFVNVEVPKQLTPPEPIVQLPPPDPGAPSPDRSEPTPPPPEAPAIPQAPAVTEVAAPSPDIAFALPVEGLTRIVDISRAEHARPAQTPSTVAGSTNGQVGGTGPPSARPATVLPSSQPAVSHLTLGQGEGRQPPPMYPREAVIGRQEGTVGLRFTVGEDGRVVSVDVISPSPWPLLNQAAARAVRETWHFVPGPRRIYDVPIEFQLNR
jgi:protein TonB